MKTISWMFL